MLEKSQSSSPFAALIAAIIGITIAPPCALEAQRSNPFEKSGIGATVSIRLEKGRLIAPYEEWPGALSSPRDSLVKVARQLVGKSYRLGAASPKSGFDCSGLVRYVLAQLHVPLPRTARQQAVFGEPVGRTELLPGDLLTFGRNESVSHVGIYLGGGRFVHASSVAGRVIISPLDRPRHEKIYPLTGARRLALAELILGRLGGT